MRLNGVQRLLEAGLILTTALAAFVLVALLTFDPVDPSWSQTGDYIKVKNLTGTAGAWTADLLYFSFGWLALLVPVIIQGLGYLLFKKTHQVFKLDYLTLSLRVVGLVLFVISSTAISSINFDDFYEFSSGGVIGDVFANAMLPAFNFTGTSIILLCFFFSSLTLLTGVSWVQFVDQIGQLAMNAVVYIKTLISRFKNQEKPVNAAKSMSNEQVQQTPKQVSYHVDELPEANLEPEELPNEPPVQQEQVKAIEPTFGEQALDATPLEDTAINEKPNKGDTHPALAQFDEMISDDLSFSALDDIPFDDEQQTKQPVAVSEDFLSTLEPQVDNQTALTTDVVEPEIKKSTYVKPKSAKEQFEDLLEATPPASPMPTLDLLDRPDKKENPITKEELDAVSRLVEVKLLDFGVQAEVVGVYPGPVVTRFELDLAPGIKVAKISGLAKDLARSLSAVSVRVVEVIPGKTYVGLELPNQHREIVRLSEVIGAKKFSDNPSDLAMVLGKDIAGVPVVADLAKMPHLLVAGTTGSGKSVGVNVMILSLLFKSTPDDVRMIMIDPKMLELSVYEGIPHLLCEVVTDMKEAANALRWCVGEMERRYKLMSALGVRNLKGYNQKVLDAIEAGEPIKDPLWKDTDGMETEAPELGKLPAIVVVIDEFADMMMIVGKKVEELIARIAQKARAAGIHLVLATQRPSVDVITGLIKANIPTRMAFQVSSKIDSRTILDQQGAEHLLGMGDMLYLPPGTSVPIRVHGAFVDDHEVHAVVNDWKARGKPNYVDEILNGEAVEDVLLPGETAESDEESDPLYDEAVAFVIESRRASVSSVQRKLRVGYNRAARLVEQMEMSGIVSAPGHNGTREVIVPNNAG
ncbi:DNA translocase FtsK [Pseudoalteromonas piratica]|uniref:DNA translocase FtsK n=1 Tax=Pseudoalteromonas piratica TaxID=1348114 RepID=A0A0A7EG33_9GAMM|nr:DNA translocase FtsK [Pseudoalteromonas piratica]AIY65518.1 cell division protein FtsK [Pseudoalteromonas piratica]